MVQFKNGMRGIAPFAIGAVALYSCGEDEEVLSNNDLLIGEWKIMTVDGESYGDVSGDGYTYSFGFKFEADGDFGYCYETMYEDEPENNQIYCDLDGEWEWMNDEQTQLSISEGGTNSDIYILSIESISADRMEGDFYSENMPEESYSVVFEKHDFED